MSATPQHSNIIVVYLLFVVAYFRCSIAEGYGDQSELIKALPGEHEIVD
jgi:hypothetical protein